MEKAKKARERDCYIKPIKAWKLMKAADEENMTTYIYGVTGSGKTSLVKHYMIRQKETYDLFDAEIIHVVLADAIGDAHCVGAQKTDVRTELTQEAHCGDR